jgi:negative regulator of replication initiation
MNIPSHEELINYIYGHLEDSGEKPSSFGRRVLNDSAAIIRLKDRSSIRMDTAKKIVDMINQEKLDVINS